MDTQLSGLRKRKSLEDEGSGETKPTDSKSPHYKTELDSKAESQEYNNRPAVNIEAMGETQEVTVSVSANKLSAALVSIDSPDELVSEHAKVAEEAIAGWEKAEIEAMVLKQRLEALAEQNLALENRANHLDDALKEVVNKLRMANEEQEQRIHEAVLKEKESWECRKTKFVDQILQLQSQIDSYRAEASNMNRKLGFLEEENATLRVELRTQSEELEIRTIERDLSAEAAEKASKQNLDSIKKIARLEAECRRPRSAAHTALSVSDQKSGAASSLYADSLTDSQSDNGERLHATDIDFQNNATMKFTDCQTSCSYAHASANFTGVNQPKSANMLNKTRGGTGIEMDLMDDFLEIERLAALPEIVPKHCNEPGTVSNNSSSDETFQEEHSRYDKLVEKIDTIEAEKTDLENELKKIKHQKIKIEDSVKDLLLVNNALEENVKRIEKEKSELETALTESQSSTRLLSVQLKEAEMKLNELQNELAAAHDKQQSYESQVMGYELEAKIMSSRVESLESKLKSERELSADLTVKCEEMEDELFRTKQEVEFLQSTISNSQLTIKQDDLAAAAGKLAECQQTIASLGIQLKSLASLDDFLTDTANCPKSDEIIGSENAQLLTREQHEDSSNKIRKGVHSYGKNDDSPASSSSSSSSASSVSQVSIEKGRNGFIKLFSRSNRGKVPA